MTFSLDTSIVVTATFGPADRLWPKWIGFDRQIGDSRFVSAAAYEQFERVVEGLGTTQPGIFDQALSDVMAVLRLAGNAVPDGHHIEKLGIPGNRRARAERVIGRLVAKQNVAEWSPTVARNDLRRFDERFAKRRTEFFKRHQVVAPSNVTDVDALTARLRPVIPNGGLAWGESCRIVAQSAVIGIERSMPVTLVAEGGHIMRNSKKLRQLSALHDVVDLSMSSAP